MQRICYDLNKDGFYGAYYPCPQTSEKAMIVVLGILDSGMTKAAVKWLHAAGCNVMAITPCKEEKGLHSFPIERFEKSFCHLKKQGNCKIGIMGVSATSVIALAAASFCEDITLTIGLTPCDFMIEGYYRDGLDKMGERPADGEAIVSYKGKSLPYVPQF